MYPRSKAVIIFLWDYFFLLQLQKKIITAQLQHEFILGQYTQKRLLCSEHETVTAHVIFLWLEAGLYVSIGLSVSAFAYIIFQKFSYLLRSIVAIFLYILRFLVCFLVFQISDFLASDIVFDTPYFYLSYFDYLIINCYM